mmetsp:Transcript_50568/g.100951  ORF Transcript_50568/g.100951 Transcript_50568/m.100951 type:complete len:212 (-) Transcript_50568:726-1361(-)
MGDTAHRTRTTRQVGDSRPDGKATATTMLASTAIQTTEPSPVGSLTRAGIRRSHTSAWRAPCRTRRGTKTPTRTRDATPRTSTRILLSLGTLPVSRTGLVLRTPPGGAASGRWKARSREVPPGLSDNLPALAPRMARRASSTKTVGRPRSQRMTVRGRGGRMMRVVFPPLACHTQGPPRFCMPGCRWVGLGPGQSRRQARGFRGSQCCLPA